MAALWSDSSGTILRFLARAADEDDPLSGLSRPPAGAANFARFDETTNAGLAADLAARQEDYRLPSNDTIVKLVSGAPVVLNVSPPALPYSDRVAFARVAAALVSTPLDGLPEADKNVYFRHLGRRLGLLAAGA